MKKRKLFCELSPFTYRISVWKCRGCRFLIDLFQGIHFAEVLDKTPLPVLIYQSKSLIQRKLGVVDPVLQDNKAVNLELAAPHVSGILIRPGEVFSFWRLVGECTAKKGYRLGLTIQNGRTSSGIGGGMCQFTNLIHWLVLHTPLTVIEHHHHDGIDLFPDYGRTIPFGTGTSIVYNYMDYRFQNNTMDTYQLIVEVEGEYLCGEIRAARRSDVKYHISAEDEYFSREGDDVYRNSRIYRTCVDKRTGEVVWKKQIKANHAKVMYDPSELEIRDGCGGAVEQRRTDNVRKSK